MPVNFLHPHTAAGQDTAAAPQSGRGSRPAGAYVIDWRAVQRADHACCCLARPVVIAIVRPGPDRPHQTELLLCGHHYRVSRPALCAAGAMVLDIKGAPITEHSRPLSASAYTSGL
jgi:hypothetical protein